MKRFITAITTIALIMTSCAPKHEQNPIEAGVTLYNVAENQQKYAIDFFYTAMRFNILMTEAKAQGISNFADVKITENKQQRDLQAYFFGPQTTISSMDSITYYISFVNTTTNPQNGILTINTAGKTLDELSENDTWHISPNERSPKPFEFVTSQYTIYVESAEMYITPNLTPHSWNVTMDNFKCYFVEDVKSDWDLNMNINQFGKTTLRYADYFASHFEFRGGSEGRAFTDEVLYYMIDPENPIVILPSCVFNFISNGNINVRIDDETPIDETRFPSREVDIKRKYAGNCKTDITVVYNGVTETI